MVEPVSAAAAAAPNVVGAAAVQGGSNVLSTLLSNKAASHQARMANNYNIMMWQAENEYNKPINQMKRFAEAGLNPNLIYGQGSAGNAGSAPAYVPADKRYDIGSAVGNALSTYMALSNMKKDAELKDAQIQMLSSKKDTEDVKRDESIINGFVRRQKLAAEVEYLRKKGVYTYEQSRKIRQQIVDMPEELLLKKQALGVRSDPLKDAPYYVRAPVALGKAAYHFVADDVDMPSDDEIRYYLLTGNYRGSRPSNVGIWSYRHR